MTDASVKAWEQEEKTVTLTNGQWCKLSCYLLMTTRHRQQEREAWEAMANDKNADGSPMFPHAASNAQYYAELEKELEEIRKRIEEA